MSGATPSLFPSLPLSVRLRAEADGWDEGEDIRALLLEAAEVVELLAAEYGIAYMRLQRGEA